MAEAISSISAPTGADATNSADSTSGRLSAGDSAAMDSALEQFILSGIFFTFSTSQSLMSQHQRMINSTLSESQAQDATD
jgi:hypothetical protein